jgi:hypothetical protein
MPRGVKKENLPIKICVVCNRPFNWRKKWERCWDEVTTCSKACNGTRKQLKGASAIHSESDDGQSDDIGAKGDADDVKKQRKTAAKSAKALTRAKRECCAPVETGQKSCEMCGKGSNLLVRCQTDATQTWRMVCGKCWKDVSGGQVDGDPSHPHYRYGGLWKNRKAAVPAVAAPPSVESAADTRSRLSKSIDEALVHVPAEAVAVDTLDATTRVAGDDACALPLLSVEVALLRL